MATTPRVKRRDRGMALTELLELPVVFNLETSNRAFDLGRSKGFALARSGGYPCRVMRIGKEYRVARTDLLRALGIDPGVCSSDPHTPANGDGPGSSHPEPSDEHALCSHQR